MSSEQKNVLRKCLRFKKIAIQTGLGIRSSVFQANRSFFVSERAT